MTFFASLAVLGLLSLPVLAIVALCRLGRILNRLDQLEQIIRSAPPQTPPVVAQPESPAFAAAVRTVPPPPPPPLPSLAPAAVAACAEVRQPAPSLILQPGATGMREAAASSVRPPAPPAVAPEVKSAPDSLALRRLQQAWNWLVVGEEFRRPDVSAESAIATVWLIRAGIVLVVCAVGFGLQLSIKRGLLGPEGRVALSLLCGSAFLAAGNRLITRQRYALMGQGLLGGGLAMLYFAFFSAHVLFKLIPALPTFGLMILVTAVAVVLALRHQSLSTAVLGTIGGFATPIMLQADQPNLTVLLAYLIILGAGLAATAIHRQWPLLVWLSLLFSTSLVAGALGATSWDVGLWPIALGGVSLLFALYSTAIFGYAVRRKVEATPLEAGGLFINTLFFLGESWLIFEKTSHTRSGMALLTLAVAVFYIAHLYVFFARKMHDRTLLTVFAALSAAALALTLPCLFSAEALTASWAILATALLWTSCRLLSRLVFNGALLLYLIAYLRALGAFFESLTRFTAQAQPETYLNGLTDRLIALGIPVLCAFAATAILRHRPRPSASLPENVDSLPLPQRLPVVATTLALLTSFGYFTLEANLFFAAYLPDFARVAVTLVWASFLWYLFTLKHRTGHGALATLCMLGLVLLAGKWLLFDIFNYDPLAVHTWHYRSGMGFEPWFSRLLNTLMLLSGLRFMYKLTQPTHSEVQHLPLRPLVTTIAIVAGLFYLTFETATGFHAFVPTFESGAVSLLWGLYALALLWVGLRIGLRPLRLGGLALFAAAGAKVIFSDLADLDIVWRLLAFGVLGTAMLLAALAYLRKGTQHNHPGESK